MERERGGGWGVGVGPAEISVENESVEIGEGLAPAIMKQLKGKRSALRCLYRAGSLQLLSDAPMQMYPRR